MKKKLKVIYYKTKNGDCPVKEFINSRDIKNRQKIASIIDYLQELGINLPRPYADYLRDGIYELRIKLSGDETRTLYFFCYENYIILSHSFIKNTNKIPKAEINKAIKLKNDFISRYNITNIEEALK
ncbi:MAG: type II toxin-antitoxin system RelE/ParE family toxin [FCB group bacterium]|jgi:phage-related protein